MSQELTAVEILNCDFNKGQIIVCFVIGIDPVRISPVGLRHIDRLGCLEGEHIFGINPDVTLLFPEEHEVLIL